MGSGQEVRCWCAPRHGPRSKQSGQKGTWCGRWGGFEGEPREIVWGLTLNQSRKEAVALQGETAAEIV